MKSLLLVANFKSNKTVSEAKTWLGEFSEDFSPGPEKEIIICPSFTALSALSERNQAIKLGAQDISPFPEGAYTGEVNNMQIKEFADYVLIGHSERRENFNEDENLLKKKVEEALKVELKVIFCVQDKEQNIPQGVEIIAYEPVSAIGTGNPATPENAQMVSSELKKKVPGAVVLYGGSVTPENIRDFTQKPDIHGVLVGGASLDAKEFAKIARGA